MITKNKLILVGVAFGFVVVLLLVTVLVQGDSSENIPAQEPELGGPTSSCIYGLPQYNLTAPYTIEYLRTENNIDTIAIDNSSPEGRQEALDWLRAQDCDISSLNIVFADFINPLNKEFSDD